MRKQSKRKQAQQSIERRLRQIYNRWKMFLDKKVEYWKFPNCIKCSYEHPDHYWFRYYFDDCYVTFFLSKSDKKLVRITGGMIGDTRCYFSRTSPDYEFIVKLQDMVYDLWNGGCLNYIYWIMEKNRQQIEESENECQRKVA